MEEVTGERDTFSLLPFSKAQMHYCKIVEAVLLWIVGGSYCKNSKSESQGTLMSTNEHFLCEKTRFPDF